MARWSTLALGLAFVGGGVSSIVEILYSWGLPEVIPNIELAVYLPVVLLSICRWSSSRQVWHRSFTICIILVIIGVAWVDPTERGRGMLMAAGVATVIPISQLIRETNAYRLCAAAFIVSSAFNLFVTLANSEAAYDPSSRMGTVVLDDRGRVTNSNQFGGQMAAAAVLAMAFFLVSSHRGRLPSQTMTASRLVAISATGAFCFGVFASASRGAIAALASASIALIFLGKANGVKKAFRCALVLLVTVALLTGTGTVEPLLGRFQDSHDVESLGDRLPIWTSALSAWLSSGRTFFIGVGTGGVDKALVEHAVSNLRPRIGEDLIARKSSHNSYVEWIVSYGLFGMLFGLGLVFSFVRRTWNLDSSDGWTGRRALLLFLLVHSMTTVVYRAPYAIPVEALLVALLLPPRSTVSLGQPFVTRRMIQEPEGTRWNRKPLRRLDRHVGAASSAKG
jgi:hypothetical protein